MEGFELLLAVIFDLEGALYTRWVSPRSHGEKAYQTSLGFFDLVIVAPSMKAALDAWGADSNLFHQGATKKGDDPDVIAAP